MNMHNQFILCALVWLLTTVGYQVPFQMPCSAESTPTLFTVIIPLSAVGEQMLGLIL